MDWRQRPGQDLEFLQRQGMEGMVHFLLYVERHSVKLNCKILVLSIVN